jgi:hypothetical protein
MKPKKPDEFRPGLHFSASALRTYLLCSWQYKLKYVTGAEPECRAAAMVLGRTIHEAVARYHLAVMNEEQFGADQLRDAFDDALKRELAGDVPVRFNGQENPERLGEVGRGLLDVYHREAGFRRILDVERAFRFPVVDPRTGEVLEPHLVGIFDMLEADEDGTVSVVEIKSSARKFTPGRVTIDLQGSIYCEAMVQEGLASGDQEALVRYDVLVKTKQPAFDRQYAVRRPGDRRMAMTIAVDALKAIERDAFVRNPGWQCSGCPFQRSCGIL